MKNILIEKKGRTKLDVYKRQVKAVAVGIILINFPWYAVCAQLFSSSMINLAGLFGIEIPQQFHTPGALLCVLAGTVIAYKGVGAIEGATKILVPLLLLIGVVVVVVGFTSIPVSYTHLDVYKRQAYSSAG